MWINHDDFSSAVGNFWNSQTIIGHPMFVLMRKLKVLRGFLRSWNKEVFGHLDTSIAKAKQELLHVQSEIEISGVSDDLLAKELLAKNNLSTHLDNQESLL